MNTVKDYNDSLDSFPHKKQEKSHCYRISEIISSVPIGRINLPLYLNGSNSYGTCLGGLLGALAVLIVILYAGYTSYLFTIKI
jgi:hypothetical protein